VPALLAVLTVPGPIGLGSPAAAAAATSTVTMSENVFWSFTSWSSTVTVRSGDMVTWENRGQTTHNAVAADASWSSGNLRPGQSFSRRFDAPGEYGYVCTLHLDEEMVGKVVVLPAGPAATPAARRLFVPTSPR
jgi:plastocyanin